MISKIRGILKMGFYSLMYRGRIRFSGVPSMRSGARIKCQSGNTQIGQHFRMNTGAYCAVVNDGNLLVGDNVSVNCNAMIVCHDRITIGSGCSIAPNVLIYDHDHKFDRGGLTRGFKTAPVTIGDNCWIGGGCIILRGTHIGEGSVIGAGCVVKGEIPPHSLVTSDRSLNIRPTTGGTQTEGEQQPDEV